MHFEACVKNNTQKNTELLLKSVKPFDASIQFCSLKHSLSIVRKPPNGKASQAAFIEFLLFFSQTHAHSHFNLK